jgi:hypothetical protein
MFKTFNPVNIPFGYCLNPSDQNHRNPYPSSDTFLDGSNDCVFNIGQAPGVYPKPTLSDIAIKNEKLIHELDNNFLNGNKPFQGTDYIRSDFANPSLQVMRPKERYSNSWIDLAGESLHIKPDAIMAVYFSDANIEHLLNTIVSKVKEITGKSGVAGSPEGVTIMKPNMDDFFSFMLTTYSNYEPYNGSICFVNLKNKTDTRGEVSKLNSNVLQEYVSKMISQINMYIYYYKDASQMPEQLSLPVVTSTKGNKTLEYNTGFTSGNSIGIASYNQVGNYF